MKLRIRGNSLRFRLTQTEVKTLADSNSVENSVLLSAEPSQTFLYVLEGSNITEARATFCENKISVQFPNKALVDWASGEEISLEHWQENGSDDKLRILVEKDFACLKPREHEDDSDAYANPNSSC